MKKTHKLSLINKIEAINCSGRNKLPTPILCIVFLTFMQVPLYTVSVFNFDNFITNTERF